MTKNPSENIEIWNIDKLIPYANNARTHSDEQIAQIASSIKEWGFTIPILADESGMIIAGHGRVQAARKLKINELPVMVAKNWTEEQKRAYVIADNKLALNAGWDDELLKLEMDFLDKSGFDLDLIGFSEEELNDFEEMEENETTGLVDDDQTPEVSKKVTTVLGDVWLLGNHRIMCGDSMDINAIEKLMNGDKADMVFTDPPYGVSIVGASSKVGGGCIISSKKYAKIIGDDTTQTAKDFYSSCVAFGFENFIIWGGNYFTDFLHPSQCWLVWDKKNNGDFADVELAWCSVDRSAKLYSYLWNGMSREGDRKSELISRVHPTQKPVGLFVNIFNDFNFNSVFDGFLGSGSTLIACEKTNKKCYGMELSPDYCDVIVKRWQDFTGNEAILESNGKTFNELSDS